jgi:hypothetical protein
MEKLTIKGLEKLTMKVVVVVEICEGFGGVGAWNSN